MVWKWINRNRYNQKFSIRDDSRQNVISTEDGLVVECKPVDATHASSTHYCNRGMQRFVDGDYAWAMSEALMIGYARNSRTIARNLLPTMQQKDSLKQLNTVKLPTPVDSSQATERTSSEALHHSFHNRSFKWRDDKGDATPIAIYHLWHKM